MGRRLMLGLLRLLEQSSRPSAAAELAIEEAPAAAAMS
jgi:hypothetical protein